MIINERNVTKLTNADYPEYHCVISFMVYVFLMINVSSIRYISKDFYELLLTICFCLKATWNQYDGVAYVYGDKTMFSKVWDLFSRDKTVEYRTKALLCFLPKWKGFLVDESAEKMNATEALLKLQNVVTCLSSVWVEEKGCHRQNAPTNFDIRKVIC